MKNRKPHIKLDKNIESKQQLLKLVKKRKMMKIFMITVYSLCNRGFGRQTNEGYERTSEVKVIDTIIKTYKTESIFLTWLKEWKDYILQYLRRENITFNNLHYDKLFL